MVMTENIAKSDIVNDFYESAAPCWDYFGTFHDRTLFDKPFFFYIISNKQLITDDGQMSFALSNYNINKNDYASTVMPQLKECEKKLEIRIQQLEW